MDNSLSIEKEELFKQNLELKDLLLKLNQDKLMYEKKVQRKNNELLKISQQYEILSNRILTQKHLIDNDVNADNELLLIIDKLIQNKNTGKQQSNEIELDSDRQQFLQQQVTSLQEQIKVDQLYYNKRIKQNEEALVEQRHIFEQQNKELMETNQILRSKLEYIISKQSYYHEALNDINSQVNEVHQLRAMLQENHKKAEEDLQAKSLQKYAQLETRNGFLVEQVKQMECELQSLEKIVTNIEQITMQTKKRGK